MGVTPHMNEMLIPVHRIIGAVCWTLTAALLLTGWAAFVVGETALGIMLVSTSCPTALGATTALAGSWAGRVASLVRATGRAPMPRPEVRSAHVRAFRDMSSPRDG